MTDRWGRIWLLAIAIGLVALSISLWWQGSQAPQAAQATYLSAEAAQRLGCKPYLLNQGLALDSNGDGSLEYVFSCDSGLAAVHRRFIWLEVHRKKVRVLLHRTEAGWQVGYIAGAEGGVSWLIDRRGGVFLALPMDESGSFAPPIELVWDKQTQSLRSAEP